MCFNVAYISKICKYLQLELNYILVQNVKLVKTSYEQNEENHQNRITTLALLKTELTSAKPTNNFSRLEPNEKPQKGIFEICV